MDRAALARRQARREQRDADAELRAELLDREEVLLGERLGRGHQRALPPASTARSSVCSATAVLPDPTSPWRSRCMGVVRPRSASISAIACSWASVSVNGSASRYRAASSPGAAAPPPRAPRARPSAGGARAAASTARRAPGGGARARRRPPRAGDGCPPARRPGGRRSSTRIAAGSGSPPARAYGSALSVTDRSVFCASPRSPGRRARSPPSPRRRRRRTWRPGSRSGSASAEAEPRAGRQPRLEPRLVEPRRADLAGRVGDVRRQDVEAPRRREDARRTVTSRIASSSPKSSEIVRSSAADS